jgi:hypothetical protein
MTLLGLSLMLLVPARAALVNVQSPALEQLKGVEGLQRAPDDSPEDLKDGSAAAITGAESAAAAPEVRPGAGSYVMDGKAAIKGVTIYTPREDPTGTARTEKPAPKGPFSKTLVYGTLGAGAVASIGGLFFPPLLFLGGFLLGIGAVLWLMNRKLAN